MEIRQNPYSHGTYSLVGEADSKQLITQVEYLITVEMRAGRRTTKYTSMLKALRSPSVGKIVWHCLTQYLLSLSDQGTSWLPINAQQNCVLHRTLYYWKMGSR